MRVPAVTAASILFVASATSAAMSASFLAPAIVASDSPARSRELIVAVSTPMASETNFSIAARSALGTFFGPPLGDPSTPRSATCAAVTAATIASACA